MVTPATRATVHITEVQNTAPTTRSTAHTRRGVMTKAPASRRSGAGTKHMDQSLNTRTREDTTLLIITGQQKVTTDTTLTGHMDTWTKASREIRQAGIKRVMGQFLH